MAFIERTPDLSVQIDEIDRHHRRLVKIINSLHEAVKAGSPQEALQRVVSDLVSYTKYHFRTEEQLMRMRRFSGYEQHRKEHEKLSATVARFEDDLRAGRVALSIPLILFLKGWLTAHISRSDTVYAEFMNGCGDAVTAESAQ